MVNLTLVGPFTRVSSNVFGENGRQTEPPVAIFTGVRFHALMQCHVLLQISRSLEALGAHAALVAAQLPVLNSLVYLCNQLSLKTYQTSVTETHRML